MYCYIRLNIIIWVNDKWTVSTSWMHGECIVNRERKWMHENGKVEHFRDYAAMHS